MRDPNALYAATQLAAEEFLTTPEGHDMYPALCALVEAATAFRDAMAGPTRAVEAPPVTPPARRPQAAPQVLEGTAITVDQVRALLRGLQEVTAEEEVRGERAKQDVGEINAAIQRRFNALLASAGLSQRQWSEIQTRYARRGLP